MPAMVAPGGSVFDEPAKPRLSTSVAIAKAIPPARDHCQTSRLRAARFRRRCTALDPASAYKAGQSTQGLGRQILRICSKSEELDTAGNVEPDAGDVAREIRAQEGDRVRDVL